MISLLIALLLALCAPARSQLGEGKSINSVNPTSAEKPLDYYDGVIYNEGDDDEVVYYEPDRRYVGKQPVFSRTVDGTSQGCLARQYILNGTSIYFNLTEEAKDQFGVSTKAEACFELCMINDPFSYFITINVGLRGNNDECGCHAQGELNLRHLESYYYSGCDEDENKFHVFCGPENVGCINSSPSGRTNGGLVLLLPFLATFFSFLR